MVRHGNPVEEIADVAHGTVARLPCTGRATPAPFARRRDREVTEALRAAGVEACPRSGTYCADVSQPRTGAGKPYAVFTPFWKAWEQLPRRVVHGAPRELGPLPSRLRKGRLPSLDGLGLTDEISEPFVRPG